ncbi:MAG: DNA mismatch repair protein MutS [Acholeplasmatales bacterium]|nr:DNA mismatch repair protein MutS [Acholeplasmatales bacterium]
MGKAKYTPMMEQYLDIKKDYKDSIVFFRLGDFYEMFFEDAHLASKELEIALTGRDAGVEERVPMCGVPFHATDTYIEKLVSRGHKVAIVEQIQDPKDAIGIVKRGVIRIVTPGTIDSGLKENENNYIASIMYINKEYVLCYSDISTGEVYIASFKSFDLLANELLSLHIKEIIINDSFNNNSLDGFAKNNNIIVSYENNDIIPEQIKYIVSDISLDYYPCVGLLIQYFISTQKKEPSYFKKVKSYIASSYLHLDAFTKRNLEITETLRYGYRNGSILWHVDKCSTAMGSRLMHKWIDKPLINKNDINNRLDMVELLNNNFIIKSEIKAHFKEVYDLERIIGRISSGNANAKDLVWLRRSLKNIPSVIDLIRSLNNPLALELADEMNPHSELNDLLESALVENPPLSVKEGGMILEGFNKHLDEIRDISVNGKNWILNYEAEQKAKTGIKTMKVGYNRITGYYIEVSKGAIKELPEDCGYERRSTLANSERFITEELKQYESMILNAKDQIESIEYEIFCSLRNECSKYVQSLQELADTISKIDCLISLSDVAIKYNYVRPTFNENRFVNIVDGRHPVLETLLEDSYIVNDVVINKYNMMLITGPNMSGKSTYMRMLASIVVLAQMGSFVPAKSADLMIFDSIFTRIGASDDLVSGQSTFMVEMLEANYAISNATKNSLVLFDEIGRGTATFDGMALAQSILEYLHEKVGCITLFSTHYHELTALEGKLKRLKNVHVEAKETKNGVAFLHKVLDGATDKSYGINVASLAGLPKSLIERSKQVLNVLEEDSKTHKGISLDLFNFDSFDEEPEVKEETTALKIKNRLDELDINKISPIEALNILYELKEVE